ncbi:MAG: PspC domain-containing protein, partial [Cyclobacteriaceae bacterium]|nr:PspC domain-containing protein [Cyclobacteriaceae bacterium]
MKKNISINISGIIFHIEEDGYETLKNYLDNISRYFSTFDDSTEIISDIEGRIAEIFLSKLTDEKQIITANDVESLMSTMGSIEDFQSLEEPIHEESAKAGASGKSTGTSEEEYDGEPRRLYRDHKRKILGGVCAGIAYYFKIDPLWVRLLTLILFVGSYGVLLVIYFVTWAVLPSRDDIEERPTGKKMFRNPDDKVIAGVSSGIAEYFGMDPTVIRLLFVVFAFVGGASVLVYIILWVALPEANTITEKVQMKGEPVTLSNIESNVKKSLNIKEDEEESALVKILLFPFRLISTVINGLSKALGPLFLFFIDFIRVMTGVVLTITGISCLFAILILFGILFGIFSGGVFYDLGFYPFNDLGHPFFMFFESIPGITMVSAFLVSLIPILFIMLIGVSVITKKRVFTATLGWSLFGVFVISSILVGITVPAIVYGYHKEAHHEVIETYHIQDKTAVLTVDVNRGLGDYDVTHLLLKGHDKSEFKLIKEFSSHGASRKDALENAKMVEYNVVQIDSILQFDANLQFKNNARFTFQELILTLYIPYEQPFVMDRSIRDLLSYQNFDRYGYRKYQATADNIWQFTSSGLECLNCDPVEHFRNDGLSDAFKSLSDLKDFSYIEINSPVTVEIRKGDDYKVEVTGTEEYVKDLEVLKTEKALVVRFRDRGLSGKNLLRSRNSVNVLIEMPSLRSLDLNQACKVEVSGFEEEHLE